MEVARLVATVVCWLSRSSKDKSVTSMPEGASVAAPGVGVGSEAAIPVLGYRLFNFWLPIPLSAILYPTLRKAGGGGSVR